MHSNKLGALIRTAKPSNAPIMPLNTPLLNLANASDILFNSFSFLFANSCGNINVNDSLIYPTTS